jgi:hypothetical protein
MRFEFALNFKRIQTYWEKSQKFSKIRVCQGLHNCNFIFPHLHREIPSFFTKANMSTYEKEKRCNPNEANDFVRANGLH